MGAGIRQALCLYSGRPPGFDDFNALFNAVLEVSGLKKAAAGEPIPVPV